MKITIDTQADTYEDIRKVLHILTNILQQKGENPVSNDGQPPTDTSNLMNMFGDNPQDVPNTPPDFSGFLNLANKPVEKKVEPARVEVY